MVSASLTRGSLCSALGVHLCWACVALQFHADRCNLTITAKILVKALMVLPANDYTLCMYLIPDKVQQEEIIAVVRQLARQVFFNSLCAPVIG